MSDHTQSHCAGQTAPPRAYPDPGRARYRDPLLVIQHIRCGPVRGARQRSGLEIDAFNLGGAYDVIVIPTSLTCATDENLSASDPDSKDDSDAGERTPRIGSVPHSSCRRAGRSTFEGGIQGLADQTTHRILEHRQPCTRTSRSQPAVQVLACAAR